jgi:hypothetical protein
MPFLRRMTWTMCIAAVLATGCDMPSLPGPKAGPTPPTVGCARGATPPLDQPRPPVSGGFDAHGVHLRLERNFDSRSISIGLPVPSGAVADPKAIHVSAGGRTLASTVSVTLRNHDQGGAPTDVRAVAIGLPADSVGSSPVDIDIAWTGGSSVLVSAAPFDASSARSPEVVDTAERTIKTVSGKAALVETSHCSRTLYEGREPAVLALYPPGYLAATGILGPLVPASRAEEPDLAGLSFFAKQAEAFGLSSMYRETYPVNPEADSLVNPQVEYEGWLYDRCATFLTFYASSGDTRFLRHSLRTCSYYESKISLSGDTRGIFTGKPDPDPKYSHLRGLLAYYALTGDDGARTAGQAIADMWLNEPDFVASYRQGHIRGRDKLWTERLLATSMEGLLLGHQMLDDPKYLDGFKELLNTAYRHVTGDARTLAVINPGVGPFPPQNCFIHSAAQHSEGDDDEPWCSAWMSELLVAPLEAYQAESGDPRVDEILVRLTRFVRDVGSSYFKGDPVDDTFLKPRVRYSADDGADRRILIPLYGAGLRASGQRDNNGDSDDNQHCADATALVAAGIRALKRQGGFDSHPIGPFKTEGLSFLGLHAELAQCAELTFEDQTRPKRDPAKVTAAGLADGLSNPGAYIHENKIGFPSHANSPLRRLSWWFNTSMLQYGLLADAGISVPSLRTPAIQP